MAVGNYGDFSSMVLRKVTKDMQPHKNPALRAGSTVPATGTAKHVPSSAYVPKPFKANAKPTARAPVAPKKAPVLSLEGGKKWIVVS